jgi:hypothetical protein
MKLFISAIIIFLGVNLGIDLLDSNMAQLIEERNTSIQKLLNK